MPKEKTPTIEIKLNNLEKTLSDLKSKDKCNCNSNWGKSCGGGVYFVGFIGAAIYYLQTSVGFWNGVLGILKAAIWPAFVVHKLLGM